MFIRKFSKILAALSLSCISFSAFAIPQVIAVERTQNEMAAVAAVEPETAFECTVKPAKMKDTLQTTTVMITQISGPTLPANAKVNAYLGSGTNRILAHVCGSEFQNKTALLSPVVISPPVTEAKYSWKCHAKLVSQKCSPSKTTTTTR